MVAPAPVTYGEESQRALGAVGDVLGALSKPGISALHVPTSIGAGRQQQQRLACCAHAQQAFS
jgi:hypothetical protein